MAQDRQTCPQCGEPVYPADDVCMSCGANLKQRTGPPPPVMPPGPPMARRPPSRGSFVSTVVNACGPAWDIFPWFYLIWGFGAGYLGFGHAPHSVQLILTLIGLLMWPLFIFWLICDVIDREVSWIWILISLFCPFGVIVYLLWGRKA